MKCRDCGHTARPGQRFCEACGAQLDKACARCGALAAAAARFCGECGTPFAGAAPPPAAGHAATAAPPTAPPSLAPTSAPAPSDGERRQLTVLFADLVGSTKLSGRLDPEALREVLRSYQRICGDCITRYGGNITQYLGDGVLAYFGYPAAHDNDAERAVLAGLAIVAEVQRQGKAITANVVGGVENGIEARVGIHTGLVVVGTMGAQGDHVDLAVGETPNLAARVQGEAQPNSVCISAATLGLVSRRFEVSALGARPLKGVAKATEIFSVIAATRADGELPSGRNATPIVGRDAELGHLLQRWELAQRGQGQAVFLSGQAGIGKSRLLEAFRERAGAHFSAWRNMHCSPFAQNSALRPVIDLLERSTRSASTDDAPDRALALHQVLKAAGVADDTSFALIGALLGIAEPYLPALGDLAPAQRRLRTLDALIAWFHADAQAHALIIVVEDLHWIDASTRDLFGMLLERLSGMPILLVFSFRPEFVPPWPVQEHISSISLARLNADQVASVAEDVAAGVAGGKVLPRQLIDEIVRRTDGVPLFVEELTKAIMGSALLTERDGALHLTRENLAQFDVPATLRDSLTARLDQLGAAKAVAQLASVLGREFDYALLHSVSDVAETELEAQLAALNRANIIQQRGVPPRSTYVFKHALIQEAAYETLLKSARQRHHRRVAIAYAERFPEIMQARPELVAHHYSRALMPVEAAPLWQQAGELAVARSGYEEAIAHLNAALMQIDLAPPSEARDAAELSLRVKIGPALMARLGMGAPETGANYARACALADALADSLGEPAERFTAMWGDWLYKNTKGQLVAAARRSEDLVLLGRALADDGYELQAHHSRWTNFLFMGEVAAARADTLQGVGLYDRYRHRHHKHLYGGHDPGVCACNFGAAAAWATGHDDEAKQLAHRAVALARELDHSFSLASAYLWAPLVFHELRDHAAAGGLAELLIALCEEHGFKHWLGIGQVASGASRVAGGDTEAGLHLIDIGLSAHQARGPVGFSLPLFAMAAAAHLQVGNQPRALELLAAATALSDATGIGWHRPEILRVQAQTRWQAGLIRAEEAEAAFVDAARLANTQGAVALEWRTVTTGARLLASTGQPEKARAMLQTMLDGAPASAGGSLQLNEAATLLASLR